MKARLGTVMRVARLLLPIAVAAAGFFALAGSPVTANIERSVIDRVLTENGSACFVISQRPLSLPLSNRSASAVQLGAEPQGAPTLAGSLSQVVATLGGELVGERPGEAWVLTKMRGQTAGIQLRHSWSAAGGENWTYVDKILPADCAEHAAP